MDKVLPPRFFIDRQSALLGFEFASGLVSIAAHYTIAMVAGATGDLAYAEELLKDLRTRVGERLRDFPPLHHLSDAIPDHLAAIYGVHAGVHFRAWDRTRDKSELAQHERYVDRMLELQPGNQFALLGKAIAAFVLRREVAVAQSYVNKCRSSTDATWRYSEAFLQLYRGRLDRARAAYRAAAKSPTDELSDYLQSEVFLQEVLDEEPEKIQLLFGLAVINLIIKGDRVAAERDAKRFREADRGNRYGPYHVWLEDEINNARQRGE
jgi:hypothetical protein